MPGDPSTQDRVIILNPPLAAKGIARCASCRPELVRSLLPSKPTTAPLYHDLHHPPELGLRPLILKYLGLHLPDRRPIVIAFVKNPIDFSSRALERVVPLLKTGADLLIRADATKTTLERYDFVEPGFA